MKKRAQCTSADSVESRMLTLRGQKVILDSDLADIYGVTISRLHEQIEKNLKLFPPDSVFPLTPMEQNEVIADCGHPADLNSPPVLPWAFTENGAVMAANVLSSPEAVRMSLPVVRAFVQMRELSCPEPATGLLGSKELASELKQHQAKLTAQLDALSRIMENLPAPSLPKDVIARPPGLSSKKPWATLP